MKQKYTIQIALDDGELWLLRRLYGKRATTKVGTLVTIAVKRAIVEAATRELIEAEAFVEGEAEA